VKAPFDGVVTSRMAHPGALMGPSAGPLLRIEQHTRLRLIAAVPEAKVPDYRTGQRLNFRVAAMPGRTFTGVVARPSRVLDIKTRTMPVELDVSNPDGKLAPGMYAEIEWPAAPTPSSPVKK
jgi:multidrug efflux pump subunit AcrA (membrane-fusion protein)